MSEFYIGILMGLNGLIIVIIEMVLIFHLESKNKTFCLISHGLYLTSLSFLVYIFLPCIRYGPDFGYSGYPG